MLFLIVVICLLLYFYVSAIKPHRYWKERGVPYLKPWPFFGNLGPNFFRRQPFADMLVEIYNSARGKRYLGMYSFLQPTLMIRDPDLIKSIGVKNFDSFPDHKTFTDAASDPFWAKNLLAIKGSEKWRDMRAILSPAFTSYQLRLMYPLITECGKKLSANFLSQKDDIITVDIQDSVSRFTNDVIASVSFGVNCNSLEDRDNDFFLYGNESSNFGGVRHFKLFLYTLSPLLMKIFRVKLFSDETYHFFTKVVQESIRAREEDGVVRPDMIHLLLEAKKERLLEAEANKLDPNSKNNKNSLRKPLITDDDIISQAFSFLLAGLGTSSNLLSFLCYELTVNPDAQAKLQKTIDETLKKYDGQIPYEALVEMKYMDMVCSESMRLWPILLTDRIAVKPFTIEPERPDEKPVKIEVGTHIWIPLYPLQRDPEHFPNPNVFDPERFSDENKHNIKPYTYMPFGVGPRACIGERIALLKVKAYVFHLLSHFDLVPVKKTPLPMVLDKTVFFALPKAGFWVGLKRRRAAK